MASTASLSTELSSEARLRTIAQQRFSEVLVLWSASFSKAGLGRIAAEVRGPQREIQSALNLLSDLPWFFILIHPLSLPLLSQHCAYIQYRLPSASCCVNSIPYTFVYSTGREHLWQEASSP